VDAQTSAALHKAEPGHDIFGEPVKDIKSDTMIQKQDYQDPVVEKVVSSVATTSTVASTEKQKDTKEESKSDVQSLTSSTTAAAAKGPAGPMDEMQAAAKEAAEELFPDAAI